MNSQDFKDFVDLTSKPGWEKYLQLLQNKFDTTYKKLEGAGTGREITDKNLNFINGMLKGIRYCKTVLENELAEYEPEIEEPQK